MVTTEEFPQLVAEVLGEERRPNRQQRECLTSDPVVPLLIVAGPGTGKTSVLVLRALRHAIVDRIPPERIMITTFTKKAAREIRSRLIEWGTPLLEQLLRDGAGRFAADYLEYLYGVDINRFVTGTLDSLCEEAVSGAREPNERPPVVIESFAANQLLSRQGEIYGERQQLGQPFLNYLSAYTNDGNPPGNLGEVTRVVRTLVDRLVQDDVDLAEYQAPGPHVEARRAIVRIFERYTENLRRSNQMDFPRLERVLLERLRAGRLPDLVAGLGAVLVDEYQDTNPLQERIYFDLVRTTGASLTVVGDDDQSLYRFRGATIELFRGFTERIVTEVGCPTPVMRYLTENYRSTPEIGSFFNSFIQNDPGFAPARIQPPKPPITTTRPSGRMPVLGMFRSSAAELAVDLADFLCAVFRGSGRPGDLVLPEPIRRATEGGDFGDGVLIAHTVNEFARSFGGNPPRERLPWRLRLELQTRGVNCFNPRGRALKDIPEVQRMLGLILECLDPSTPMHANGPITTDLRITNAAKNILARWRAQALTFAATNPPPNQPPRFLQGEIERWRRFARYGQGNQNEWPLLDVLYSLMPWLPPFQDDPECQVYLEAVTRCVAQAATFSAYRTLILRDEPHRTRSVECIIRDALVPIAEDIVEVDEEIMPSVPRDRLNIMTIHQAKGLEFPLVIVDVSSDFRQDNHLQRFRRFPDGPSSVTLLEDALACCTPIGPLRTARTAIQRTFEDLTRLYYVSYSRPQSLLMLVGCIHCLRYDTSIRHIATFWRGDGTWAWRRPRRPRPTPSEADNVPITRI